jgi:hypothetical protein
MVSFIYYCEPYQNGEMSQWAVGTIINEWALTHPYKNGPNIRETCSTSTYDMYANTTHTVD